MEKGIVQSTISENARRALMVILSLDEDLVVPVLKSLDANEIRSIHELSSHGIKYNQTEIFDAYERFLSASRFPVVIPGSERKYIERLTQRSRGREESKEILETSGDTRVFESMEKHNPETVARLLMREDPQLVAAVISELSPAYAADVLKVFGRDQRAMVLHRLVTLEAVPGSTYELLRNALNEQLADLDTDDDVKVDGVGRVSSILQRLSKDHAEDVLEAIEEEESTLAQQLRREMFNFEGLINIQNRGMQALIKEIGNDQFLLALKTCSDELKDKFLSSVSKRAAEVILDDLSVMGPVRLSEVDQAQQEIVDTALRLEAEGKLVIAGRGGEVLV